MRESLSQFTLALSCVTTSFLLGIWFAEKFLWAKRIRSIVAAERERMKITQITEVAAIKMDLLLNCARDKSRIKRFTKEEEITN